MTPYGNFLIFILQALFNYFFMITNVYVFCSLNTYGSREIVEPCFSLYRHLELAMPANSCMPELGPIKI